MIIFIVILPIVQGNEPNRYSNPYIRPSQIEYVNE